MKKKLVGGIVLGVVAFACCASLLLLKNSKDDKEIVADNEVKKIENVDKIKENIPQAPPKKAIVKVKQPLKADLYNGVPDSLLPLSVINEISTLNENAQKLVKNIVDNSTGIYYAKRVGNKLIMVVENPDDNRHGIEFVEITSDGKKEKINMLLSKYSETTSEDDLWEYEEHEDIKRPIKHTKMNDNGDIEFVETWNYSSEETVKYELKDKDNKVISLLKETVDDNNNMRQEHLIYDKNGKTKLNMTVNYDGADLTRFTYYNSDNQEESGSVFSEYRDGVKMKETVYTSDYKVKNVYQPEYKDGERYKINVMDNENNKVEEILSK